MTIFAEKRRLAMSSLILLLAVLAFSTTVSHHTNAQSYTTTTATKTGRVFYPESCTLNYVTYTSTILTTNTITGAQLIGKVELVLVNSTTVCASAGSMLSTWTTTSVIAVGSNTNDTQSAIVPFVLLFLVVVGVGFIIVRQPRKRHQSKIKSQMKQTWGCPKCNSPISYPQQFCANCGSKITWK